MAERKGSVHDKLQMSHIFRARTLKIVSMACNQTNQPKLIHGKGSRGKDSKGDEPNRDSDESISDVESPLCQSPFSFSSEDDLLDGPKQILPPIPNNSTKYSWHRESKCNNPTIKTLPKKLPMPCVYLSPTKSKLVRIEHNFNFKSSNKVWNKEQTLKYPIGKVARQTKFKVDKRANISTRRKSLFNLENLFPKHVFKYNKHKPFKKQDPQRTRHPSLKTQEESTNKKLVNIGGIPYRVTSKKMTRMPNIKDNNGKPPSDKTIINVQGQKYLVSENGAKLRRLSSSSGSIKPRERLDFGGVTFRKLCDNILVRTNSHATRNVLVQAKQRSIACLAARRRKINQPCLFFRKFGRCYRNEQNNCIYSHDKKNVDLCKKYLRGNCTDMKCLLSHDAVNQKMATCQYYLAGTCFRDNCPYLHVKVSAKAQICREFLQGYCPSGDQCCKRHTNICPDFEKIGICKKGKKCPYPHNNVKRKKRDLNCSKFKFNIKTKKKLASSLKKKRETELMNVEDCSKRYYVLDPQTATSEQNQDLVPKRQTLNQLPAFIALPKS